ncbi:MAG: signal peptidase II [Coriobacteriales bacterium]|jgi:signal peptidase II|nr:signal peptidase II [Coriobacteriales bacterium]
MRKLSVHSSLIFLAIFSLLLVLADIISKQLVLNTLADKVSGTGFAPLLPGVIELRLAYNTGAAFGMFDDIGFLFRVASVIMAAVAVIAIIIYTLWRPPHLRLEMLSLSMICSGAIGNAIDRLDDGVVTDFFNFLFIDFAIFNVADICLTCGCALLVILIFIKIIRPEQSDKNSSELQATQNSEQLEYQPDEQLTKHNLELTSEQSAQDNSELKATQNFELQEQKISEQLANNVSEPSIDK